MHWWHLSWGYWESARKASLSQEVLCGLHLAVTMWWMSGSFCGPAGAWDGCHSCHANESIRLTFRAAEHMWHHEPAHACLACKTQQRHSPPKGNKAAILSSSHRAHHGHLPVSFYPEMCTPDHKTGAGGPKKSHTLLSQTQQLPLTLEILPS